jgi:hypothetical protein
MPSDLGTFKSPYSKPCISRMASLQVGFPNKAICFYRSLAQQTSSIGHLVCAANEYPSRGTPMPRMPRQAMTTPFHRSATALPRTQSVLTRSYLNPGQVSVRKDRRRTVGFNGLVVVTRPLPMCYYHKLSLSRIFNPALIPWWSSPYPPICIPCMSALRRGRIAWHDPQWFATDWYHPFCDPRCCLLPETTLAT